MKNVYAIIIIQGPPGEKGETGQPGSKGDKVKLHKLPFYLSVFHS